MFGFLFKTTKWNRESAQQELASLILNAAVKNVDTGLLGVNIRDVFDIKNANNWSMKETSDRCVHAVTMIKTMAPHNVYIAARREGQALYQALRS